MAFRSQGRTESRPESEFEANLASRSAFVSGTGNRGLDLGRVLSSGAGVVVGVASTAAGPVAVAVTARPVIAHLVSIVVLMHSCSGSSQMGVPEAVKVDGQAGEGTQSVAVVQAE